MHLLKVQKYCLKYIDPNYMKVYVENVIYYRHSRLEIIPHAKISQPPLEIKNRPELPGYV